MDSQPDSDIQIAGYRIEARVGRGGMGEVFRAVQLNLGRRVALKILDPRLAADDRFRRRFLRESRIAASIDHPSIIPIYETGEDGGLLYIAMRYVDGPDLATLLRREGRLEPARAMAIMTQVASALDAAHERGLVHRDVKPANILLATGRGGSDGHCYLCDFGLIKQVDSEQVASALTATDQFVGTIPYVAPEQIEGAGLDGRTDVYSLGCVLFQCLTGSVPFEGTNDVEVVFAHLGKPPPTLSDRTPGLPSSMDAVIARAMAKVKEDRWPTCTALVAALTAQISPRSPHPTPTDAAATRSMIRPPPQVPPTPAVAAEGPEVSEVAGAAGEPEGSGVPGAPGVAGVPDQAIPAPRITDPAAATQAFDPIDSADSPAAPRPEFPVPNPGLATLAFTPTDAEDRPAAPGPSPAAGPGPATPGPGPGAPGPAPATPGQRPAAAGPGSPDAHAPPLARPAARPVPARPGGRPVSDPSASGPPEGEPSGPGEDVPGAVHSVGPDKGERVGPDKGAPGSPHWGGPSEGAPAADHWGGPAEGGAGITQRGAPRAGDPGVADQGGSGRPVPVGAGKGGRGGPRRGRWWLRVLAAVVLPVVAYVAAVEIFSGTEDPQVAAAPTTVRPPATPKTTCRWSRPEVGTAARSAPLAAIRAHMGWSDRFVVDEMRSWTGSDKQWRWYVKAHQESDPSRRGRWLVRQQDDGQRLVLASARFTTKGYSARDWRPAEGQRAQLTGVAGCLAGT